MELLVGLAVLAVLAIPFAISLYRSNELLCFEVTRGKMRVLRGRAPARLLNDLEDVVRRPKVPFATVRIVSENGKPRVLLSKGKIKDGQIQQLRNVVGRFQVAEIRAGGRVRRKR
jgi:hypothetical protein